MTIYYWSNPTGTDAGLQLWVPFKISAVLLCADCNPYFATHTHKLAMHHYGQGPSAQSRSNMVRWNSFPSYWVLHKHCPNGIWGRESSRLQYMATSRLILVFLAIFDGLSKSLDKSIMHKTIMPMNWDQELMLIHYKINTLFCGL
jgi:hypothetical protein